MAGFRKAKGEQAALKLGLYGPPGSGKTFTALLIAEGLAKITGKRIAFVDTEHGTDFYSQTVLTRAIHPEAFDFDALYSRALTEVRKEVQGLDPNKYGVLIIDSITHLWEAAKAAYEGKQTKIGTIPLWAWGSIKKPYKDLEAFMLSSPMHVIECGRQANEFADDEDGELKKIGVKMKAEGETPYEPHILIHLINERRKDGQFTIKALVEKDRTGVLTGKIIEWPSFDNLARPLLGLLGQTQAKTPTQDETSATDAANLAEEEMHRSDESARLRDSFQARFTLAKDQVELDQIAKEISPEIKKQMLPADVTSLKEAYLLTGKSFPAKSKTTSSKKRSEPVDDEKALKDALLR